MSSILSTVESRYPATRSGLLCLLAVMAISTHAQSPNASVESATVVATEPTAMLAAQHSVVRWNGTLPLTGSASPETIQMRFAIYADQAEGLALWSETQSVHVDAQGHYSVLLGAASTEGLSQTLFPSGEPRWIEARPLTGDESQSPRTLFAAVPYAFKSVDAETLGGRAATDYLTRDDVRPPVFGGPSSARVADNRLSRPTPALELQTICRFGPVRRLSGTR